MSTLSERLRTELTNAIRMFFQILGSSGRDSVSGVSQPPKKNEILASVETGGSGGIVLYALMEYQNK